MLNKIYKICFVSVAAASPLFASAALENTSDFFDEALTIVTTILIPLVFSLALLFFFYGVAKYIWSAGDKEESKKIMVWGVIALFVMTCIWGIIYFVSEEIGGGVGDEYQINVPTIGGGSSGERSTR